jgi:hypothetical protein
MPLPYFRHRSPYYYLAWAGLYLILGLLALAGVPIPLFFGRNLAADVMINLASPFIFVGGGFLAGVLADRFRDVPWLAWPFLLGLWALTILLPGLWLFKLGGWSVFLTALLFFSRVDWFFLQQGGDRHTLVMFARGLAAPFVFFAPALIVSCLWVGRSTISIGETDWVPQFGVVYFGIQAWFEEFMLRRAEKMAGG